MKVIRNITILYTVLMLSGLAVLKILMGGSSFEKRDIAYYNDLLYQIREDYEQDLPLEEIEAKYDCCIVFSRELDSNTLAEAYEDHSLVMDFTSGGEYIGKVIWDDEIGQYEDYMDRNGRIFLIFWFGLLMAGYLLIFVIYRKMVRPVREMSAFSDEIAKGNLDIKLPIHKDNMFGVFVESFDIMREELIASRKREMEKDRAKKEMAAALSHDINTPVASIQAVCDVMEVKYSRKQSTPETEDTLEKVRAIRNKAETISRIMDNVMHVSMEELEKIEVDITSENSECIEQYLLNLRNYGNIILDDHISPCLVSIDRLRMEQVIDNVIGNSCKYAGTDIHVSFCEVGETAKGTAGGNGYIRITIRDSGPGVDERDLPLITDKYYRGASARNKTGYGLGMFLVKMYMEKQGGGVECYNDNGFVVELLVRKS